MAVSVVMAYLVDHHWYVTYQVALLFGRTFWWVQLAGVLLSVIGCVGMAANITARAALLIGVAFVATGLLLPLWFGGLSILNVHDWRFSLFLPVLLVFFEGTMLGIVGAFRVKFSNDA